MEFNLTPEQTTALALALYWVGSLARILWPYVLKRIEDGSAFDWRYVTGQAVTSLGVFILALINKDFVQEIGALGLVGGLLAGFAAASIGRNGQKTVDLARK